MKSDVEIYLEQQQKLHELGAYKRICTFLHPSKKAIVKEVKTIKRPIVAEIKSCLAFSTLSDSPFELM